jgi:hypothetical protein
VLLVEVQLQQQQWLEWEVQLQQQQWLEWEAQQHQWWVVPELLEQQQAPWLMGQEQQQPTCLGVEGDQEQHRLIFMAV